MLFTDTLLYCTLLSRYITWPGQATAYKVPPPCAHHLLPASSLCPSPPPCLPPRSASSRSRSSVTALPLPCRSPSTWRTSMTWCSGQEWRGRRGSRAGTWAEIVVGRRLICRSLTPGLWVPWTCWRSRWSCTSRPTSLSASSRESRPFPGLLGWGATALSPIWKS